MRKLFEGIVANGQTLYVELPVGPNGETGADIQWLNATASAAITFETTGNPTASHTDATAYTWKAESAITITGPAASAAGSEKVEVSFLGPGVRARLKIVGAAASPFLIFGEGR